MRFFPLGYPVDIAAHADAVLRSACESWRSWPALFDVPAVRIEVEIHEGPAARNQPQFEAGSGGRLKFECDPDNFATFDPTSRIGRMVVSAGLLKEPGRFRHHFLEAVVLTALDSIFFTPLHAACVVREHAGILLCGDSGAGKSSLAYACARHGWTFVSDDAVHLAPGPERTGVGGSNLIHLREPARALFPELDAFETNAAPNGKSAIEIDAAAHGFRTARHATVSRCLFLIRRPGPAAVRPFSTCAAVRYFLKYLEPRDTSAAERHLREFLTEDPMLLEYGSIEDAVGILDELSV